MLPFPFAFLDSGGHYQELEDIVLFIRSTTLALFMLLIWYIFMYGSPKS